MDLFTDATVQKKCSKAVIAYMAYFGSRYVGNDIQVMCGNILDTPLLKTFTLFCIMFQATDSLSLALVMCLFFLIVQYMMSSTSWCDKYVDKTSAKNINIQDTIWATDQTTDKLGRKLILPEMVRPEHKPSVQMAAPTTHT